MLKRLLYTAIAALFIKELFFTSVTKTNIMIAQKAVTATSAFNFLSRYLTMWNMFLNTFFWSWKAIKTSTDKYNSYFFVAILFPLSIIVGIYFWALQLIDPELLQKGEARKYWTSYDRHFQHTVPMVLVILECLVFTSKSTGRNFAHFWSKIDFEDKFMGPMLFCTGYVMYAFYCFVTNKAWPYPFLDAMWNSAHHYQFGLFVIGSIGLFMLLAKVAVRLNN